MEYILQQWAGHGIPDAYLTRIFVGGLYSPEFKIAIKEKNPRNLANAVQYAKQYPQVGVQIPSYQPPTYQSQPMRVQPTKLALVITLVAKSKNSNMDLLNKLVEEMANLRVQITNALVKRLKPTNTRTNVWCTNCQGHSHLPIECPSTSTESNNNRPRCAFCGRNHPTNKCWNLASIKQDIQDVKQVLQTDSNKSWINKTNINQKPFTKPNNGPPYRPNNNCPRWNDTYNEPLVWNGPPFNPNTHRYGSTKERKTSSML